MNLIQFPTLFAIRFAHHSWDLILRLLKEEKGIVVDVETSSFVGDAGGSVVGDSDREFARACGIKYFREREFFGWKGEGGKDGGRGEGGEGGEGEEEEEEPFWKVLLAYGKRHRFIWQKRPVNMAKETYPYGKRDLFT